MTSAALTKADFRRACGQFATGVAVLTVERHPGRVHGMTANSVTSVSLEPLLVLVCIDQKARALPLVQTKRRFGISVLKEEQKAWSEYFARPDEDEETEQQLGIRFRWTESGIPLLEDTLAQMECQVVAAQVAGDHTVFIAEVVSVEVLDGRPLLFFAGKYARLGEHLA
jgi:flavin reductase (DIM6/NTAB) family NADH-FMN oxidoreductase RutF